MNRKGGAKRRIRRKRTKGRKWELGGRRRTKGRKERLKERKERTKLNFALMTRIDT